LNRLAGITCVAVTLALMTSHAARANDERPSLDKIPPVERATVKSLRESPHWPFRVFALMRLERYAPDSTRDIIVESLEDDAWQVRCFAAATAARMGLAIAPDRVSKESDPYVIRTLLRTGVTLSPDHYVAGTQKLLRSRDPEELVLGAEIAAASDVESLRLEASKRLAAFMRRMNDQLAAVTSRRLGVLLGVPDPPMDADAWRVWLRDQPTPLPLPAPSGGAAPSAIVRELLHGPSPVAELDPTQLARLRDYIDTLKQRQVDVAIVMDCTASMQPMINEARVGVDDLILFLGDISATMRLAFVAYRDEDNPPITETHRFTDDIGSIRRYLFGLKISGGADYPEAVSEGLEACQHLDWNRNANRQVIVVGDAPPHKDTEYRARAMLEAALEANTPVNTVHVPMRPPPGFDGHVDPRVPASDPAWLQQYNQETEETFRQIAHLGGGQMAKLRDADDLVPAIMHFSIEQSWWPVFDAFYEQYVELCR
jgi:hypothetical protein